MFHDARNCGDRRGDVARPWYFIQGCVQDVIALVREVGRPTRCAKRDARSEFHQARTDKLTGKRDHFHRQREFA